MVYSVEKYCKSGCLFEENKNSPADDGKPNLIFVPALQLHKPNLLFDLYDFQIMVHKKSYHYNEKFRNYVKSHHKLGFLKYT